LIAGLPVIDEQQGRRGEAGMKSHKTRNDLKSAKAVSIDILNARVADAIDLALATKQAIGISRE
jgi:hypothetical protein